MAKKKTTSKKTTKPKKKALNSQTLAFCRNLANGSSNTEAYLASHKGVTNRASASACAVKLLRNASVIQKVEELREAVETKSTLSRLEKRQFLKRAVETPITSIDPNDKENGNADLIQERTVTISESGSETTKIKGMSKLEAIKIDNLMQGDNEPDELNINNTGTIAMSPIEFVCQNAKTLAARKKNKKS